MFDFLQAITTAISDICSSSYTNSGEEEQSSISDWMVYSSIPIVAGTDNIGSLFCDDNSCENFSISIN